MTQEAPITGPNTPGRPRKGIRLTVVSKFIGISGSATILGLIIILCAIFGLRSVSASQDDANYAHESAYLTQELNHYLAYSEGWQESMIRLAVLGSSDTAGQIDQENLQGLKDSFAQTTKLIEQLQKRDLNAEQKEHVDALAKNWSAYQQMNDELISIVKQGTKDSGRQASDYLDDSMWDTYETMQADVAELAEHTSQAANKAVDEASGEAVKMQVLMWVIYVAALITLVALTFWIVRALRRSVAEVKNGMKALASGDLTYRTRALSHDELGEMAGDLNQAQAALRKLISATTERGDLVANAVISLTATGAQVEKGVAEVDSQAGVVNAATMEVSRSVQTVTAGAEEMGVSIREISTNANEAARVASEATMVAEQTSETVAKLGQSSEEIGEVIRTITAIAEQTNLLALNATIEAARAGEAGKGFAVVAGEVKELAAETGRATEEIGTKINQIQADTEEAVQAISQISHIIASINDYQTTIAAAVEEQTATTNEMSRSVAEAASGIEQISASMGSLAQTANESREAVDTMTSHFSSLNDSAEGLKRDLDQFKVEA